MLLVVSCSRSSDSTSTDERLGLAATSSTLSWQEIYSQVYWVRSEIVRMDSAQICTQSKELPEVCAAADRFKEVGGVAIGDCVQVIASHPDLELLRVRRCGPNAPNIEKYEGTLAPRTIG